MQNIDNLLTGTDKERFKKVRRLQKNPQLLEAHIVAVAFQKETVPQIKNMLRQVVEIQQQSKTLSKNNTPSSDNTSGRDIHISNRDHFLQIAPILRHEIMPIIGSIQAVADEEFINFEYSKTYKQILSLIKKINDLPAIFNDEVEYSKINIYNLITEIINRFGFQQTAFSAETNKNVTVELDRGILDVILSNLIHNAYNASIGINQETNNNDINISVESNSDEFYIRIVNKFNGNGFTKKDVIYDGLSSSSSNQGKGIALVENLCERMKLTFTIEGAAGTATTIIRGKIKNV